jgi:hypothetical protein
MNDFKETKKNYDNNLAVLLYTQDEFEKAKQKIKQLTEVKMAREKSEERLKKQSEEFLKVQEMNQVVYDILGAESDKTGLLLRSQEVIEKLKNTKADLQKELS